MTDYLRIPGHIPVSEAATRLHLSKERILQLIRGGRLPAVWVSNRYMIPEYALASFRRKPTGRVRTKPVPWREYRAGTRVFLCHLIVPLFPDCLPDLQTRLTVMREQQAHLFPGTMQRYLFASEQELLVLLIWKDTEMKNQDAIHEMLLAFRRETSAFLDWERAAATIHEALLHT